MAGIIASSRPLNLDHARGHFLVDLEHVLDLVHAFFADLRNVHEAVNIML